MDYRAGQAVLCILHRSQSEEARKVVWPTRKETMQTTGIVFAFVVVMAIFLWMVERIVAGSEISHGQEA